MTEQRQTAPAPHFPQTEFLPGPVVTATCPCGWRAVASSHEHSVQLGRDHKAAMQGERNRQADEAGRSARIDDLSASIRRISETGGYWQAAS